MARIKYIDREGATRFGTWDVATNQCRCSGGKFQPICLPSDTGERGYGYSHGGEDYRRLIDAMVAKFGEAIIRKYRDNRVEGSREGT